MAFSRSVILSVLWLTFACAVNPDVSQSSKKFFKKDYPSDLRPKAGDLPFNNPYPHLQGKHTFHKDIIADDDGDSGEWKAQVQYDHLRQKLKKDTQIAEK